MWRLKNDFFVQSFIFSDQELLLLSSSGEEREENTVMALSDTGDNAKYMVRILTIALEIHILNS